MTKHARDICVNCGRPIVIYNKYRGKVTRPPADHDLCQKCWKAELDRTRESNNE